MTRAAREAIQHEQANTDSESRFIRTNTCRLIPLTERAVQLKLARKLHGKTRSEKKLESLCEVFAPESNILKVSPATSTIKEPGKPMVTVRNSDIAKFGTTQERQTPLKVYADRRGPRTCEKLVEEQIQSHIMQFTCKLKGDMKKKNRTRDPGSGVSSSRSKISCAMRGRIPKIPNFVALRNQTALPQQDLPSKLVIPEQSASSSALQQVDSASKHGKRSSDRTRRSPSYYGLNRHQIQQLQPLPNVHAEREMLKIISRHLTRSSKLSSILRITSRTKSTSSR